LAAETNGRGGRLGELSLLGNLKLLADGETMGVAHAVGLLDRADRDSIVVGDLGEGFAGGDVMENPIE
jgi:hypothetical protein